MTTRTKRIALLSLMPLALSAALLFANYRRQQTPVYVLSHYPRTQALQTITRAHLQRQLPSILTDGFRVAGVTDAIFYMSWFDGHRQIPTQHAVDRTGRYAAIYGGATPQQVLFSVSYSRLAPTRMAALEQALLQMPPDDPPPAPHRLLIVSFQDGPTWTTRLYDRAHLPAEVARIFPLATKPQGWPTGAFKP